MPVLTPTDIYGHVVWLGRVADRSVTLCSDPVAQVTLSFAGIEGEYHSGLTRASCSRVVSQYPVGTEISNTRQLSILSAEELAATAAAMGLDALRPEWLGASMIVEGIADFTLLPASSRLIAEGGASIVIDMENAPCQFPARVIEAAHPGHGKSYKPSAKNRRGVTAWVEREGVITLGDRLRLHVPPQRTYPHL